MTSLPTAVRLIGLLAGAVLLAPPALAQASESPAATPTMGELATLRLRYGVAIRSGRQTDIGPGLQYSGLTPNDLALSGALWLHAGHFGAALSLQREGFSLYDAEGALLTGGSLLRGQVGPTARIGLGPVRLEGLVGYGFDQLPSFGSNSLSPQFAAAQRHALVLGARAELELPFELRLEARGTYPLALFALDGAGASATASGFSAGAALSWRAGSFGNVVYSVVADYQFVQDALAVGSAVSGSQTLSRAGLALELGWLERPPPPPPPRHGGLRIRVVDAETGALLESPELAVLAGERPVRHVRDGEAFAVAGLAPGEVLVKATAAGYLPAEGRETIVAGADGSLELRVKKEPPRVGALAIALVDKGTAAPVAGAVVHLGDRTFTADGEGKVTIRELPPGPIALRVEAASYRPADEVAQVVVFKTSSVPLQLVKAQKAIPATITGVVRSTRGGRLVKARLEILEAKLRTDAGRDGTFSFQLPGGTYTVRISARGFLSQRKSVTVKDGDQAIFNVDLHPD